MDQRRSELQTLLEGFTDNVYFQPPQNVQMIYPCIVYRRDNEVKHFADDKPYNIRTRYMITIIDPDPDSDIPKKVRELPLSTFNRFYVADNLNHDVYTVFF
jgi:hypothetical protein